MVVLSTPKFLAKFHHHRSLLHNSFIARGSSSLKQHRSPFIKGIASPFGLQIRAEAAVTPISSSSNMVKAIRVHELGGPEVLCTLFFGQYFVLIKVLNQLECVLVLFRDGCLWFLSFVFLLRKLYSVLFDNYLLSLNFSLRFVRFYFGLTISWNTGFMNHELCYCN